MMAECTVAVTELLAILSHVGGNLDKPSLCVTLVDAAAQHFQVLQANVATLAEREEV